MSIEITTESARYYKNSYSGASAVVGYESSSNRVARYRFTTPAAGAYRVSIAIKKLITGGGDRDCVIRFFISESDSDYANAGAGYEYHGSLNVEFGNGIYTAKGTANVILKPNQVYYLWVFPGTTTYGYWYWNTPAVLTVEEGSGIVYISNGSRMVPAIPYIHNGISWVQAMPYIYKNGTWTLCS